MVVGASTTPASSLPPPSPYNEPYWIICEIILVILTLVVFVLLFVVTCYTLKLKKKNNSRTTRNLLIICLLSTSMAFGRLVSDQFVAFWGWQTNENCRVATSVSIAFYILSVYPAYIFLWYRQNIFYSDKTLRHLLNKSIGIISKVTLVVLALSGTAISVMYQIPSVNKWKYEATQTGCRDVNDEADVEILIVLFIVITFIIQFCLLGLLLYPLITTKKRQQRTSTPTQTPTQTPSQTPQPSPSPSRKFGTPRKSTDLARVAMMGAHSKRAGGETLTIEMTDVSRRNSVDSSHGIYKVGRGTFSSDDESIRSGSDAGLISEVNTYTSQSEFESDNEGMPFTSAQGTLRKKRYIRREDRNGSSRPGTPSRGSRRGSNGSVSSAIWRRIRKSSLKKQRRKSDARKEKKLKLLIRKVFLLCCVCVFSDVIVTVLQLAFVVPELVYLVIFDINLFVNIVCLILSFKEWKKILIAPIEKRLCKCRRNENGKQPNQSTTSPVVSQESSPTAVTNISMRSNTLRHGSVPPSSGHQPLRPPVKKIVSSESGTFDVTNSESADQAGPSHSISI